MIHPHWNDCVLVRAAFLFRAPLPVRAPPPLPVREPLALGGAGDFARLRRACGRATISDRSCVIPPFWDLAQATCDFYTMSDRWHGGKNTFFCFSRKEISFFSPSPVPLTQLTSVCAHICNLTLVIVYVGALLSSYRNGCSARRWSVAVPRGRARHRVDVPLLS